jgi:hypothetical protein
MFKRLAISVALAAALTSPVRADAPALDTARIEQAMGMKGTYNANENVFKVTKPRQNMAAVAGRKIPPFLGTSSYAAFTPAGNGQVLVMGDNVLFEDEVGPAMNAALENGLEVTALHNHFFFEEPRIYFMHIDGMGDSAQLGAAVKKVLEAPGRVRSQKAAPASQYKEGAVSSPSRITAAPLESIFGKKGETSNGMFKVSFGYPVKMHGATVGDAMGANTWAGFAGTDDKAAIDGDFAVSEDELQPVLKSLRGAGINIVAIHQHMTHEEPRLMFLHYWGQGKAQDLARAVQAAIKLTSTKVSS